MKQYLVGARPCGRNGCKGRSRYLVLRAPTGILPRQATPPRPTMPRAKQPWSIREMRPGVWRICVDAPREPRGKRQQCYRTIHGTQAQASREAARFWAEVQEAGAPTKPVPTTLGEHLDEWMETAIRPHLRPNSVAAYDGAIARLKARLGDIPLSRLRALDIERAYAEMRAGYSPRTIRYDHVVLGAALARARRWGLIAANPMEDVTPPRVSGQRVGQSFSAAQAAAFLSAIEGNPHQVRLVLALGLGLRAAEVIGLQWPDLDLDALVAGRPCVATVERQWIAVARKYGPLKSGGARRVGVPEFVAKVLREELVRQEAVRKRRPGWNPDGLVACGPQGRPVGVTLSRVVREVCAAAGLPSIRYHDLRHTIASLRAEAGENPAQVADELGHGREMYIRTYVHVSPAAVIIGAERVNRLLGE